MTEVVTEDRGKVVSNLAGMVWGVAELLRGDFRPSEYGRVILPLLVARRMDLMLAPTMEQVVFEIENRFLPNGVTNTGNLAFLRQITGCGYYRKDIMSLDIIRRNPDNAYDLFVQYINGFSNSVSDIFDGFRLLESVERLNRAGILQAVLDQFVSIDVHPDTLSNAEMGDLFEGLIRRFSEASNETAGEHFTPRDAVDLVISLVLAGNDPIMTGKVYEARNIYDPTAGTGGFLSVASERFRAMAPGNSTTLYGQELNAESYAICKADMLSKGDKIARIMLGNTLSDDKFPNEKFHYMISNPPYGVDWKKVEGAIVNEHQQGDRGRFAPGLPRSSDGQFLFLMHLISKFPEVNAHGFGGRIAIVMNSAPMASGGAGSGESEIRRYILENDLLESVVSLPNDMFYNTGIGTYIWILTNSKAEDRRGKVMLVDASSLGSDMAVALGSKRRFISTINQDLILSVYRDVRDWDVATLEDGIRVPYLRGESCPQNTVLSVPLVRVVDTEDFLYREVVIERPKYDGDGNIQRQVKGKNRGQVIPDADMRAVERIPFSCRSDDFLAREITPFVPEAFLDNTKERVGAEISWGEHFFVPETLPSVVDLDAQLRVLRDLIFVEGV